MNDQQPEKPSRVDGAMLSVHSIFPTIQGEGPYAGKRATFLRMAGCNLQCPLCDTEYTQGRKELSAAAVAQTLIAYDAELVVITGGEPLRQDLAPLVRELGLLGSRKQIQIETNGTLDATGVLSAAARALVALDIVVSPKTGTVAASVAAAATAWKYVMRAADANPDDGLPDTALGHPAHPRLARPPDYFPRSKIYLQPADEQDAARNLDNQVAVVRSVLQFGYRLCLQQHKIIGVL